MTDHYTTARENLRILVRGAYDIQKLRIQMGNRITANFKAKLGQEPGEKEDDLAAAEQNLLRDLRASFARLTDGVATFPRQATFTGDELISSFTELVLVSQYLHLEATEKEHFRKLDTVLREFAIWTDYLKDVTGVGPAMAGVIISEIDIRQNKTVSGLWALAGLDVAKDGRGRSRRKEHLIDRQYTTADGELATRKSITFNPFLKTKLVGVLGSSFVKTKGPYRDIYDQYKHRLETDPRHEDKSKGHRHNMAVRYTVKMFLRDLYNAWRTLEGLEIRPTYQEEKLGHRHSDAA